MVSGGVVQVWPCDHSEAVWTILYDGSTKYNKYTADSSCSHGHTVRVNILHKISPHCAKVLKLLKPDQDGPIDLSKFLLILMHEDPGF